MAYIIPKVFSSEMTPDQKKNLVARSGNNETINKILAVALASGDNIMNSPEGTIVDRWNEFVDSPENVANLTRKMYGVSPDQLSNLPTAVYDENTDEFIAGAEHIAFHDCNPNRLYIGLVSVGKQPKAVVKDEVFDAILMTKKDMYRKYSKAFKMDDAKRIETEIKSMMSAGEHSMVAQREQVVETALTNVATVENKSTNKRVPRIPFINNKDAGSRKRNGIATSTLGTEDFDNTVQVIFNTDYQRFQNNDKDLVNRMMTVNPSKITALASTLTGPKGAVYSSQHDTLAREVKEAAESNLIDRSIAEQIYSKITNTANFNASNGVGADRKKIFDRIIMLGKEVKNAANANLIDTSIAEQIFTNPDTFKVPNSSSDEVKALYSNINTLAKEVKAAVDNNVVDKETVDQMFTKTANGERADIKKIYAHIANKNGETSIRNISSSLVDVSFTPAEMKELVKLFTKRASKMNITTQKELGVSSGNNQDNQDQRTKNGTGEVSEGAASEAKHSEAQDNAFNIAENMDAIVEERGEINQFLSAESKNALNNIIQLYNNIKRFGGTGALFNDPIFVKNAAFLSSGKITDDDTEYDLGGDDSTSAETNVCNMVTGVMRALISYNNGSGWSFFDASKVKVENRDGNWYITDWGLTPEAMIEYTAYKERGEQSLAGKRNDDTYSTSNSEEVRTDTATTYDDEFIGLLLSEMYDPKHMAYGVSGPIKALVKTEMKLADICSRMDDVPDTHGGVTLNRIIAGKDNADAKKDKNGEAWDELLRYPRVSINNTLEEITEQVKTIPDDILRDVACTLLYVNYPKTKDRALLLNSKDFLSMLRAEMGDDKYDEFGHRWRNDVNTVISQCSGNPSVLSAVILESCIFGEMDTFNITRDSQIALIKYLLGERATNYYRQNSLDTASLGFDENSESRSESHKTMKANVCKQTNQNMLERIVDALYLKQTGGNQNVAAIGYDDNDTSSSNAVAVVDDASRETELYKKLKTTIVSAVKTAVADNADTGATETDGMALVVQKLGGVLGTNTASDIMKQLAAVEHLAREDGDIVALMLLPGTLTVHGQRMYINSSWADIFDHVEQTGSTALAQKKNRANIPFGIKNETKSLGSLIDSLVSFLGHKGYTPMSEMYKAAVDTHSKDNVIKLVRSVERALGGNANFSDGDGSRNVGVIDFGFDVDKLTNFDDIEQGMGFSKRRKENKFAQAVAARIKEENDKNMNATVSFDDLGDLGDDDGLL